MGLLSLIITLPLFTLLVLVVAPEKYARPIAITGSIVAFAASLFALSQFAIDGVGLQFEEKFTWIPTFGIFYHLGLDQLSIWLVVLATFLGLLALSASYSIESQLKMYYGCFLLLITTMVGVFSSHDFFLFYIFWEMSLFPLYVIIALWGSENRLYASLKMFLYTLFGSVFLLIGIFLLHSYVGTFDVQTIMANRDLIPANIQMLIAGLFTLGFAVKLPMVPFHTWLPDAHVQAPTAGSMLLAGVLLKMGGYGIMRFVFEMFPTPAVQIAFPLFIFGLINIVYGAFLALAQTDLKKLVAYSSISHMGFVLVGLASLKTIGIAGALFQMIAHGITSPAMFFCVGLLYYRTHSRELSVYGGLATKLPKFAVLFAITAFASLGLPGLIGFVGEFTSLAAGFATYGWWIIPGGFGVFLAGMYILKMFQGVLWGDVPEKCEKLVDLSRVETFVLGTFVLLSIVGGLIPTIFLPAVNAYAERIAALFG